MKAAAGLFQQMGLNQPAALNQTTEEMDRINKIDKMTEALRPAV